MVALIIDKIIYEDNNSIMFSEVMSFFFFVKASVISLKFIYKRKVYV